MSDEATREIDPRFDPRFQRGYVPDAAGSAQPTATFARPSAETPAARADDGPARAASAQSPAIASSAPARSTTTADDADHAAALLAYFAPEADPQAAAAPEVAAPGAPPARAATYIGPPPSHAVSGMNAAPADSDFVVEPEPVSESPFVRHPALGFWVVLGTSLGFVVAGAVLTWNINYAQMSGRMTLPSEGQAFINAMSALGAGLVQAGVLGIVVVLAVQAVRSGRGRRS
ncbi:hypothetical protein [Agromyces allii]|uniref:Uncharacterized protein n=1 Tax=Agromyces allii TaxID=393607 RepID=A0ABN2QN99_9MICO|nr:hypothetical protein [Agromyces allii]